jgi:hypothetical protein
VGRVLGICFGICFVTGMLSHYQYHPWTWLPEPAAPVWAYRLTQGLHVITGITSIPLLLVKLWTVYPKLFEWPPVRSTLHGLERASIAVLVASSLLELSTGFFNALDWYPWPWDFVFVHRQLGYIVIGSLLVHIAVKLPIIRDALGRPLDDQPTTVVSGLSRRGLLVAAATGAGLVTLTTAGQSLTQLEPIAGLAPRLPKAGPLGLPINKLARDAGFDNWGDATWRLTVLGPRSYELDLAAVEALQTVAAEFPMSCVEGWSVSAHWRGPSLLSVIERAGGGAGSRVKVTSLERRGSYRTSIVDGPQVAHAILATHLNGHRITPDHGYPLRLIAPDRAGVLNTKWLTRIEVL